MWYWYEVREYVDDIPWIYESFGKAYRKAKRVTDRTGYPVMIYKCSNEKTELIAVVE